MNKKIKAIYRLPLITLAFLGLTLSQLAFASITNSDIMTVKTTAPVGTRTPIFRLSFSANDDSSNWTAMTIEKVGGDFSLLGLSSLSIYKDEGDLGQFNPSIDTLIKSVTDLSGDSIGPTFDAQNIPTGSNTAHYFIVITVKESTELNTTIQLDITDIEGTGFDEDPLITPSTITASGIEVQYKDIKPDFVFPGQENVAPVYILITPKGESTEVDTLKLTINDSNGHFIESANKLDGVTSVELYKDNIIDLANSIFSNTDANTLVSGSKITPEHSDNWSQLAVTLNFNNSIAIDTQEAYWPVYTIGENVSVTSSTSINLSIPKFFGTGSNSFLEMRATPNLDINIPVAGVSIDELKDITTGDTYGTNTHSPILSFQLTAHQAPTTINKITIINKGSIPFNTDTQTTNGKNIKRIEVYQDSDSNDTFSILSDTLTGSLDCHVAAGNSKNNAVIPMTFPIASNTSKTLFTVYYFGSEISPENNATKNYVQALVGTISATGNYVVASVKNSIGFNASNSSDESPLSSDTTANITLNNTNTEIAISSINIITPTTTYSGQTKIPMLYCELTVDTNAATDKGAITIINTNADFTGTNTNITRVWIFSDSNENGTYDTSDTFLSSTSTFTEGKAIVQNVSLDTGTNKLLILYSAGTKSTSTQFLAQIESIEAGDKTITALGTFPTPESPASITPIAPPLSESDITLDTDTVSGSSFELQFSINNTSGSALTITEYKPKFYYNDIGGQDISAEFTSTASIALETLADNTTSQTIFDIIRSTPSSEGTAIIDVLLNYRKTGDPDITEILLERSFTDTSMESWDPITKTLALPITNDMISNDTLPAYIKDPLQTDTPRTSFLNGSSLKENKLLIITLNDPSSIDESSIAIQRGTTILTKKSTTAEGNDGFSFNSSNGEIRLNVGTESSSVILEMNDLFNNALPTTTIRYIISSTTVLSSPLFYPNPYVMGTTNLKLGFSIAQPSTVTFHIFNFLGQKVYHNSAYKSAIGFNTFEIPYTEPFLVPGIYICRIIATDSSGNTSAQTTKLAIH